MLASRASVLRRAGVAILAGALAGCAAPVHVSVTPSNGVQLNQYRTFVFEAAPQSPAGFAASPASEDVKRRIEQIATTILQAKGYVISASAPADVTFRVSAGRREREVPCVAPGVSRFARRRTEEEQVFEGAFDIEAYDTIGGELVWRACAQVEVEPGVVNPERLRRAVSDVLAAVPAR